MTGSLQGLVVSTDDAPIVVSVSVSGPSLQGSRVVEADAMGHFRLLRLPVGSYSVRITAIGYQPLLVEDVRVRLGSTTTLGQLRMQRARAVELPPVTVTASQVLIDPTSTNLGANIDARVFEYLPLERNYRSVVALLPHANQSFLGDEINVGGSTGLENIYYIDGVNVTEPYRASTGTNLPYNFIKEVQVKQGGYQAEYGKALGGIVNVVTHSGGNEWEGTAFGFFTNHRLAGEAFAGLEDLGRGDFASYDIGFRLSGPIVRDRLQLSAAYNPRFETAEVEVPGHGFFDERRTLHAFAGKLTWRTSERSNLVLSVSGDPTTHDIVEPLGVALPAPTEVANPDPFLGIQETGSFNISLDGNIAAGRHVLVDVLAAHYTGRDNIRGQTERGREQPLFVDNSTNTWSDGYSEFGDIKSRRTALTLAVTTFLGSHTVKVGGGLEENRIDQVFDRRVTFADSVELDPVNSPGVLSALYTAVAGVSDGTVHNRVPHWFIQDSWRALERLTINVGIRWEGQYLIGIGDSVAQDFPNQWQPRVGFVYLPGELGSQKIFGSFGRFYQQLPLQFSAFYHKILELSFDVFDTDPRDPGAMPIAGASFNDFANKQEGLEAEHLDEFTLGYERAVGRGVKVAVRGIHRALRNALVIGFQPEGDVTPFDAPLVAGNPGSGDLSFLPSFNRKYSALEFTVSGAPSERMYFQASYVLSRTHGNYAGLYNSDVRDGNPAQDFVLTMVEQIPNSTGRLPNDRTHVLKVFGGYRFDFGFTPALSFTWQTGTPLSEFGVANPFFGTPFPAFLQERGAAARTPTIWDLNLRLTYEPPLRVASRITLDILHLGSPRRAVDLEQTRFLGIDASGNQVNPNPTFGSVLAYQPPVKVRLGLEVGF
jgi:hypothetical protein